jgi:hypothetical protein
MPALEIHRTPKQTLFWFGERRGIRLGHDHRGISGPDREEGQVNFRKRDWVG